ncbi:geranylgeranyl diphosphate reductase [Elioraea thermophila]|uniref:geranylgeranyl diphosphate reductase n=1 Tax=Elioraea thermophila TaxID=2185104 RepID=UPI000DF1C609|nr:geranylgeranyl diphosphate reductase [Elioraea thermophila]
MTGNDCFDVVVVGGGPAGATAAADLARAGRHVLLLDKAGRIKPCGGAIPPKLITDFAIPDSLLVAKVRSARIVSPSAREASMPVTEGGFVGMVDREHFDEWLRNRAALLGAERRAGTFERVERDEDGTTRVLYHPKGAPPDAPLEAVRTRAVIGADGANSAVARQCIPGAEQKRLVFAYHEIVRSPKDAPRAQFDGERADVYYRGSLSPDFYAWIFPHGETTSVGTGSAHKGFSLKGAVRELREIAGLDRVETIRREGAPIPLKPLKRWDDGQNILLAGDAAGVVAPASGEGIYYAMLGGRFAAEAVNEFLATGKAAALAQARRRFMRLHGPVFWILGIMQDYWYGNDARRERFVSICRDPDVQYLTWDAYMNKELVKARPLAHVRIFFKNLAHLTGIVPAWSRARTA